MCEICVLVFRRQVCNNAYVGFERGEVFMENIAYFVRAPAAIYYA